MRSPARGLTVSLAVTVRGSTLARLLARSASALPTVILLSACIPQVTHGPVVRPGVSGGGALTLGVGKWYPPVNSERDPSFGIPGIELIARRGTATGPFGPPAHVGVQLEPFGAWILAENRSAHDWRLLTGSSLDLYTQFSAAPGAADRGGGVLLGIDHVAPYFEYGRPDREGGGWFTVQQLSVVDVEDHWLAVWGSSFFGSEKGRGKAGYFGLTANIGRSFAKPDRGVHGGFFALVVASVAVDFFRERPAQ